MRLIQFPPPPGPGAYVLAEGYDHWILPEVGAFWRYVLTRAALEVGVANVPPRIFDCATAEGGTPSGHPPGSHNHGLNLDIGYAMTGNPRGDYIVGPSRNSLLTGEPNLLDLRGEATILGIAAELDLEFNGRLIQQIAVDPRLGGDPDEPDGPLEREIRALFPREVYRQAVSLINSSESDTWDRHHHHHKHIRHLRQENGEALVGNFDARTARLLAPGQGTVLTVEERLAELERRMGAVELAAGVPRGDA